MDDKFEIETALQPVADIEPVPDQPTGFKLADTSSKMADTSSKMADTSSKMADTSPKMADTSSKMADNSSKITDNAEETAKQESSTTATDRGRARGMLLGSVAGRQGSPRDPVGRISSPQSRVGSPRPGKTECSICGLILAQGRLESHEGTPHPVACTDADCSK